jgi:hypothetical protein
MDQVGCDSLDRPAQLPAISRRLRPAGQSVGSEPRFAAQPIGLVLQPRLSHGRQACRQWKGMDLGARTAGVVQQRTFTAGKQVRLKVVVRTLESPDHGQKAAFSAAKLPDGRQVKDAMGHRDSLS